MSLGSQLPLTQISHATGAADQPDHEDAIGAEVSREPSRCGRPFGARLCLLGCQDRWVDRWWFRPRSAPMGLTAEVWPRIVCLTFCRTIHESELRR
jgi:hypothetical protein